VLGEVERLKRESSGDILCHGGSQLASTLQAGGLVDEYALFVHPTALGAGKPFFRERVPLRLLDQRRFKNGTFCVHYGAVASP
jgi:dihydrofolate reductase